MPIIAKPDQQDDPLGWDTFRTLESMLMISCIENKSEWIKRLNSIQFEYEGLQMIEDLREYMPIPGLHTWPHGQGEDLGKAIRYQVDKDNFKEQRWKK